MQDHKIFDPKQSTKPCKPRIKIIRNKSKANITRPKTARNNCTYIRNEDMEAYYLNNQQK